MNGLKRNTAKLFSDGGKLFLMALDRSQCGLCEGLEDVRALMRRCADTKISGFLVNNGIAPVMAEEALLHKKLALRSSFGGTLLSTGFSGVHANHVSPETALALGADAVVMMFVVGGDDAKGIQQAARDIDAYHRLSIPVIVEILSADPAENGSFETQANGARVAAELGADVVKAFYCENFERLVACCPAPVLLAGGPKSADLYRMAESAVKAGVKGFAFGRNLFLDPNAPETIARLYGILHAD